MHIGRKLTSRSRLSPLSRGLRLRLPKAAKHASRHHCTVRCEQSKTSTDRVLHIEVFGQNGMLCQGETIACGEHHIPVKALDTVFLGFYSDYEIVVTLGDQSCPPSTARLEHIQQAAFSDVDNLTSDTAPLESEMQSEIGNSDALDLLHLFSSPAKSEVSLLSAHSSPLSIVSANNSPQKSLSPVVADRRQRDLSDHHTDKRQRTLLHRSSSAAPSPYAHQEDDGFPPESSDEEEQFDEAETERKGMTLIVDARSSLIS